MSRRTKKVGSSGRFGPRYGVSVKKRIKNLEANQKKGHDCPRCHYKKVHRVFSGVWECSRCGNTFAGGAYTPMTGPYKGKKALFTEDK